MTKLFAHNRDRVQTHSVASNLGLHCLLITLVGVSRLKWIKLFCCHIKFIHLSITNQSVESNKVHVYMK